MSNNLGKSPAEAAANQAIQETFAALASNSNFRLEAGAGAGKTYSLIKALQYLIHQKQHILLKGNKQIACITYTEVARDQIRKKVDNNPNIFIETIHAFSWNLIKNFQSNLRELIPFLSDRWTERLEEIPVKLQRVIYSLGYPKITDDDIFLHHDDVIYLMTKLLSNDKFKRILTNKFPIILIDEYQDTNKDLAIALVNNFIETKTGPLIGLFGDHWQKIYDSRTCGLISAAPDKLQVIGKNANFRSDRLIVEALNKLRPQLPQNVRDPTSTGEILIFHTNDWNGHRRTENHWQGDLPADIAHNCLLKVKGMLRDKGWDLKYPYSKILMLTNNVLANEQGYFNLANLFRYSDDYLKKGDSYIEFFADVLEPACMFFKSGNFGEMFKLLNLRTLGINSHRDKIDWNRDMQRIINARENGCIGDVISILQETKRPRLSTVIEEKEERYAGIKHRAQNEKLSDEDESYVSDRDKLKSILYQEVIRLVEYIDEKTPFSTKHGVKGEEFDNVIVVLGRGWNNYNWNQMLEWFESGVPSDRQDSFERNRNLFYVSCSRPKHKLCLLFTQKLSDSAMRRLSLWFGQDSIQPLNVI